MGEFNVLDWCPDCTMESTENGDLEHIFCEDCQESFDEVNND